MDVSKLLIVLALILFGFAVAFFINGEIALGAAMIAIASSQIAVFSSLKAKAKRDDERQDAAQ